MDSQIANLRKRCFQIKEILVNFKWNKKSYILSALCCFTYAAAKNSWREDFSWCRKHVEELLSLFSEDTGSRKCQNIMSVSLSVLSAQTNITRRSRPYVSVFSVFVWKRRFLLRFQKNPRPLVAFLNRYFPSVRKRNIDWKRYHLWREHAMYWYPTP